MFSKYRDGSHWGLQKAQQQPKMCLFPMGIWSLNRAGNTVLKSDTELQKVSLKDWEHISIFPFVKLEPGDLKCSVKLFKNSGKCCRLVECVETALPAPSSLQNHFSSVCSPSLAGPQGWVSWFSLMLYFYPFPQWKIWKTLKWFH